MYSFTGLEISTFKVTGSEKRSLSSSPGSIRMLTGLLRENMLQLLEEVLVPLLFSTFDKCVADFKCCIISKLFYIISLLNYYT